MFKRVRRVTVVFTASLLVIGCSPRAQELIVVPQAPVQQQTVEQDAALAISTAEVMALLAGPDAAKYVVVDARPQVKFEAGHVPGALSLPKAVLEQNLDQLPRDKTLIFYCGGLHCSLSPASAAIAMQHGYEQVKVWYEGMPGWVDAGNYAEVELPYLEKLVTLGGKKPFVLVDARPAVKYSKAFIPGAVSIPKAEFGLKKGLLPADKNLPVIFYCGGYACKLSHQSARLALDLGYSDVAVFPAGEPAWREAGLPLWGDEASGVVNKPAPVEEGALPEAIFPEEFQQLVARGKVQVVDVRDPEEYAAAHIAGAINIFDEDFIHKPKESCDRLATDKRVVLVCSTGARSASAYYAILGESDYPNKKRLQYLDNTLIIAADGSFEIK